MKKYAFILLAAVGTMWLAGCSSDDDDNSVDITPDITELPATAQEFVATYFYQYEVSKIVKNDTENERGSIYESWLLKSGATKAKTVIGDVKIEFDRDGNWTEIESLIDGTPIPTTVLDLLPPAIVEYVNANYPHTGIEEIEKKAYGYKVELINEKELLFDKNGDILSDTQAGQGSQAGDGTATASIETFVNTHFAGYTIAYIKNEREDGRQYKKVYLKNGYTKSYKVVFDSNEDWVEVEGDDDLRLAVPESVMQLLPEGISTYIKSNYASTFITEVKKKTAGYEVELANDVDLLFNANGDFLRRDD